MRSALMALIALVAVFAATPAFAEDGKGQDRALAALGLGNMQVVSDAEGMQVRGKASWATATGGGVVTFVTFFPLVDIGAGADFDASFFGSSFAFQHHGQGVVSFFPVFGFSFAGGKSWAYAQ